MPARVFAVVEAALRVDLPPATSALWVDAFCIPWDDPERSRCLAQLGAIYAGAAQVIVVLSAALAPAIAQMIADDDLDLSNLLLLEQDPWITRSWTYQEVVNCTRIWFTAEGAAGRVSAQDMLRIGSKAIHKLKVQRDWDSVELDHHHPALGHLMNVLLDWRISGYLERSAYQVMVSMRQRQSLRPDDNVRAMLGTIGPIDTAAQSDDPHPGELFMQLCEAQGDLSFIYTQDDRSTEPGRSWRPAPVYAPHPVFPWHTWGKGQRGQVHATHVTLEDMICPQPAPITDATHRFLAKWTRDLSVGPHDGWAAVKRKLIQGGFVGCLQPVEYADGLLYANTFDALHRMTFVAVATQLRLRAGALALLIWRDGDVNRCVGTGVFVGLAPTKGEPIDVA